MRPFIVGVDAENLWLTLPADRTEPDPWSFVGQTKPDQQQHHQPLLLPTKAHESEAEDEEDEDEDEEDEEDGSELGEEDVGMDLPFGIGTGPGPSAPLAGYVPSLSSPSSSRSSDPEDEGGPSTPDLGDLVFDPDGWFSSFVHGEHSPRAHVQDASSANNGAGLAMMPPLGAPLYQAQPAPLNPSAIIGGRHKGQPAVKPPSSPIDALARETRSTSLPPPSLPRPVRRRTQESADIPTIAAFYPALFPPSSAPGQASAQPDGMSTLAPAPVGSGTVNIASPSPSSATTKPAAKPNRPTFSGAFSSYAPLPTPSSEVSTPFPFPTPGEGPGSSFTTQGVAAELLNPNPATDYPLNDAEVRDVWDRLKRDFAGVDPANLRGPFKQLAMESFREATAAASAAKKASSSSSATTNGRLGQTGGGSNLGDIAPSVTTVVPSTTTISNSPTVAANAKTGAGGAQQRTTVSPKEAFVDYDDVSHRLSDSAQRRGSPGAGAAGAGIFSGIGMERNPSNPFSSSSRPNNGVVSANTAGAGNNNGGGAQGHSSPSATAMDRRASGGGGSSQGQSRSSPSGHGLPPHRLPKNAMRISDSHHHHPQPQHNGHGGIPIDPALFGDAEDVGQKDEEEEDEEEEESEEDTSPGVAINVGAGGGPGSYFPPQQQQQQVRSDEEDRLVGQGQQATGRVGGKTVAMGRSRSHPPEGGRARYRPGASGGAGRRHRTGSSSPEAGDAGLRYSDGPAYYHTRAGSVQHHQHHQAEYEEMDLDGGDGAGGHHHPHHPQDELEEDQLEEEEEEEEEEDDDYEDEDWEEEEYRPSGRSTRGRASGGGRGRGAGAGGGGRKRKSAGGALPRYQDFIQPSTKRQRVAYRDDDEDDEDEDDGSESFNPHASTSTWHQDAARRAHGRAGTGSIRCDWVDPGTGEVCDVVFRRPYDLARHKETIHEARGGKKKVQWVCGECQGTFSRKDALMRHCRIRNHNSGL